MIRPGRFEQHIYLGLPTEASTASAATVLSVSLFVFSQADIIAIITGFPWVHDTVSAEQGSVDGILYGFATDKRADGH